MNLALPPERDFRLDEGAAKACSLIDRNNTSSSHCFPAAESKIRGDIKRSSDLESNEAHRTNMTSKPGNNLVSQQLAIERFLRLLRLSPRGGVFNPWWQSDTENDIGPQAPGIRATNYERICLSESARRNWCWWERL